MENIKASPGFSLMIDESTDVGGLQHAVICLRFINKVGVAVTKFVELKFIDPKKGAKADTLLDLVMEFFVAHGLDPKKMKAFGSDGASVMLGERSGLATRLAVATIEWSGGQTAGNPQCIGMHCCAHRLALVGNDSFDGDAAFKSFEATLSDLYTFYSRSPKRTGGLLHICQETDEVFKKQVRPCQVRWLSRATSCSSAETCLPSIFAHLQEVRDDTDGNDSAQSRATAGDLFTRVSSFLWVAMLLFMTDILALMAILSRHFQHDDYSIDEVTDNVNLTIKVLQTKYLRDSPSFGPKLHNFLAHARTQFPAEDNFSPSFTWKGVTFHVEQADYDQLTDLCVKFATSIRDGLTERFPNIPLLDAFSVFDPKHLNVDGLNVLPANYGLENINTLLDHFTDIDRDAFLVEWQLVCERMWINRQKTKKEFWTPILRVAPNIFPLTIQLVVVDAVAPLNTACCERGFSLANNIKTDLRNRMKTQLLNSLMQCNLNGPDMNDEEGMEDLLRSAFATWCLAKNRMPQRSSKKPRPGRRKAVESLKAMFKRMIDDDEEPESDEEGADEAGDEAEEADEVGEAEAEADEAQQMDAVGPFPFDHADFCNADGDVLLEPLAAPDMDDPSQLKGKLIGIKYLGINRWHVGKVVSYKASNGTGWVIFSKDWCSLDDDEEHWIDCGRRRQFEFVLNHKPYGVHRDWVLLRRRL